MKLHIRPAAEIDVPDLTRLVNAAYRGDSSRVGWTTEADLLGGQRTDAETLRAELSNPNKTMLLGFGGEDSETLIACVNLERFEFAGSPETGCYLGMLTVDPTLQAQGIGKKLMNAAENYARTQWAASRMTLGVLNPRSELMAWYERQGYSKNGYTKPFPSDDPRFGLPKVEGLHLIMFEKPLR